MVGYTSDGIAIHEPTKRLSWSTDGGLRGFDLARNIGLTNTTESGAGEFLLSTRPTTRMGNQLTTKQKNVDELSGFFGILKTLDKFSFIQFIGIVKVPRLN